MFSPVRKVFIHGQLNNNARKIHTGDFVFESAESYSPTTSILHSEMCHWLSRYFPSYWLSQDRRYFGRSTGKGISPHDRGCAQPSSEMTLHETCEQPRFLCNSREVLPELAGIVRKVLGNPPRIAPNSPRTRRNLSQISPYSSENRANLANNRCEPSLSPAQSPGNAAQLKISMRSSLESARKCSQTSCKVTKTFRNCSQTRC